MKWLFLLLLTSCSTLTLDEQWAQARACEVDCEDLIEAVTKRDLRQYEKKKVTCGSGKVTFCRGNFCQCMDWETARIFVR